MLAFGLPAPKGVAEEVEAGVLRLGSTVRVLAVHDLRLVGVQLQSNGPEPLGEVSQQISGLTLGCAVDDRVVSKAVVEPGPGPRWLVPETLELVHCPPNEVGVNAPHKEVQLGAVEGPVVVDPASDLGIDVLSEPGQIRSTAPPEMPAPDLLANSLLGLGAHGW